MTPQQRAAFELQKLEEERQRANMAMQQGLMDRLAEGPKFTADGMPTAMTPTPNQAENLVRQSLMSPANLQRQQNFMRGMQEVEAATRAQEPRNVPQKSFLGSIGSFIGDRARDPAYMARLAAGLQAMTLNPNQQFIQGQLQRAGDIRESRQAAQESNKTAEYLKSIGRPDLASVIEINPSMASTILSSMFDTSKGVVVGEDERVVDPLTGRVLYGDQPSGVLTAKQRKEAGDLVNDYTGNAETKAFQQQTNAYVRILKSAKDPSAAGDLSLIFNYMKVLDPGSVVRESEFATAARARAEITRAQESGTPVPTFLLQGLQKLEKGTLLLPEQRNDFVNRAGMLYQGAQEQHMPFRNFYEGKVESIAPGFGLPPIGYAGDISITDDVAPPKTEVLTVPPSNWEAGDAAWQSLSDDEKRQYLEEQ